MRRSVTIILVAIAALATPVPAGAQDGSNVELVRNVPFDAVGAIGAEQVGSYLYLTGFRTFSIYESPIRSTRHS